jgi:hypothetical protein
MTYRSLRLLLLLAALLLLSSAVLPTSRAQNDNERIYLPLIRRPVAPPALSRIDTFGGNITVHTVVDDYAYIAREQGVSIYSLANLSAPQLLGRLALAGEARNLLVSDDRLYLVTDYFSLLIVDVADRRSPRILAEYSDYDEVDYPQQLLMVDNLLAVIGQTSLRLFDASNPTSMELQGQLDWDSTTHSRSHYEAGYLYVGSRGRVRIIDVRAPAQPVLRSEITVEQRPAVAKIGATLYLADGERLRAVDVQNPAAPREIGGITLDGEFQVDLVAAAGRLYLTTNEVSLRVLQVVDRAAPAVLGSFDTADGSGGEVAVLPAAGAAFVADGASGRWSVVALADAANPQQIAQIATPIGNTYSSAIVNDRVYVTEGNDKIAIIDIGDPRQPRRVGRFATAAKCAEAIVAVDNTLYVAGYGGLQVFDISNPNAPEPRGLGGTQYVDIAVADGYAYLSALAGLAIWDVRDPLAPNFVSFLSIPGQGVALAVAGKRVYFASDVPRDKVLHVVDVADPSAPRIIGSFDAPFENSQLSAEDVAVQGTMVYLAASTAGLAVLDASDPANIRWVGQYDVRGIAGAIALEGDRAFLTDRVDTLALRILDISDPMEPGFVIGWQANWSPNQVSVQEGTIALATFGKGLQLLQYDRSIR